MVIHDDVRCKFHIIIIPRAIRAVALGRMKNNAWSCIGNPQRGRPKKVNTVFNLERKNRTPYCSYCCMDDESTRARKHFQPIFYIVRTPCFSPSGMRGRGNKVACADLMPISTLLSDGLPPELPTTVDSVHRRNCATSASLFSLPYPTQTPNTFVQSSSHQAIIFNNFSFFAVFVFTALR